MIDKAKVSEAIAAMVKNPDWRDVLVNAPGAANLRIGLAFYASKFLSEMDVKEKDEYREFREMLERQLNAEELKYLEESFARMGVDAARDHYNELFGKKSPEEQAEGTKAYNELVEKLRKSGNSAPAEASEPAEAQETPPERREQPSAASEGDGGADGGEMSETLPEGEETPPEGEAGESSGEPAPDREGEQEENGDNGEEE